MAAPKQKLLSSPAPVPCSVCLDVVDVSADRSFATLKCGHQFHLDCIGSAFNAKGAMQCPNCRQVEGGQWLYAGGCSLQHNLPANAALEEGPENLAGVQYNLVYIHDERVSRQSAQHSSWRIAFSNREMDHPVNSYLYVSPEERHHQRALVPMPSERISWRNQPPVTPGFNTPQAAHDLGSWNLPSEAVRSLRPDVNLSHASGVYLQRSHPMFQRTGERLQYSGNMLLRTSNTAERHLPERWIDGDAPSHQLGAGSSNVNRHFTERGTTDMAVAFIPALNVRSEATSQTRLMQGLRAHMPLVTSGHRFQGMRRGADDQGGHARRVETYSSNSSVGDYGHRWGDMTSGTSFNNAASASVYTSRIPLHRVRGQVGNNFETRNSWL